MTLIRGIGEHLGVDMSMLNHYWMMDFEKVGLIYILPNAHCLLLGPKYTKNHLWAVPTRVQSTGPPLSHQGLAPATANNSP